jgi:hypothetical protein
MRESACGVICLLGKSVSIGQSQVGCESEVPRCAGKRGTTRADDAGEAAYLVQSEKIATTRGRTGNQLDNSLILGVAVILGRLLLSKMVKCVW